MNKTSSKAKCPHSESICVFVGFRIHCNHPIRQSQALVRKSKERARKRKKNYAKVGAKVPQTMMVYWSHLPQGPICHNKVINQKNAFSTYKPKKAKMKKQFSLITDTPLITGNFL